MQDTEALRVTQLQHLSVADGGERHELVPGYGDGAMVELQQEGASVDGEVLGADDRRVGALGGGVDVEELGDGSTSGRQPVVTVSNGGIPWRAIFIRHALAQIQL